MRHRALLVLVACAGTDAPRKGGPPGPPPDAPPAEAAQGDGAGLAAAPSPGAPPTPPAPPAPPPEVWLRGSTHVHARPSGDSSTPISDVMRWYEAHGYDLIALTDHNQISEVHGATAGSPAVHAAAQGLIVLAGIELTYNPAKLPPEGRRERQVPHPRQPGRRDGAPGAR